MRSRAPGSPAGLPTSHKLSDSTYGRHSTRLDIIEDVSPPSKMPGWNMREKSESPLVLPHGRQRHWLPGYCLAVEEYAAPVVSIERGRWSRAWVLEAVYSRVKRGS
jgi:hypothetical protein